MILIISALISTSCSNARLDILIYQLQSIQKIRLVCRDWLVILRDSIVIQLPKIHISNFIENSYFKYYNRISKCFYNRIKSNSSESTSTAFINQLTTNTLNYTKSLHFTQYNADFKVISKVLTGKQLRNMTSFKIVYRQLNEFISILELATFIQSLSSSKPLEKISISVDLNRYAPPFTMIYALSRFNKVKSLNLSCLLLDFLDLIKYLQDTKTLEKVTLNRIKTSIRSSRSSVGPVESDPSKLSLQLMEALANHETIQYLSIHILDQLQEHGSFTDTGLESIINFINKNKVLKQLKFPNIKVTQSACEKCKIGISNTTLHSISDENILSLWKSDSGIREIQEYHLKTPTLIALSNHLLHLQSISIVINPNFLESLIQLIKLSPKHLTKLQFNQIMPFTTGLIEILVNTIKENLRLKHLSIYTLVNYQTLVNLLTFPTLQYLTISLVDNAFNLTEFSQLPHFSPTLKSLKILSQYDQNEYTLPKDANFDEMVNVYGNDLITLIQNQKYLSVLQIPTPFFYKPTSIFTHLFHFNLNEQQLTSLKDTIKTQQHLHTIILSLENSNINTLLRNILITTFE
ncbi:hypothetical protein DLAC_07105 [Tieghemostelium lacteum]|uniref:Uncharacterized protein n=1 Tax=Tieghemostelium lacteum TaxID=361077 RepID=A0A151ZE98_TIELA|nr:hypothetical protein DLAC_07105 [Tieghemostelium lacteum]|eukprot:KYQ92257.1 hypothetical protein DLAC_07105 [Tieghemostelium lacteum]